MSCSYGSDCQKCFLISIKVANLYSDNTAIVKSK